MVRPDSSTARPESANGKRKQTFPAAEAIIQFENKQKKFFDN
ncbi:hypothetical protein [Alkalicoccus halolimnae]|uniref:Uncharacterized protein n=1 Tax=Alkalicoccus halolimnae TaxID=1667239 RepID=A0AAJ8N051_9BACI|nr:hypothetical protein [Alkalicoccus halolimnae]